MQNSLVQQLEKRADVLAVVKERIFTTTSCSITQTRKDQCTFQGMLGLVGMLGSPVKVGEGGVECVLIKTDKNSLLQFQCDGDF